MRRGSYRIVILVMVVGALPGYLGASLPVFGEALMRYYQIGMAEYGALLSVGGLSGFAGVLAAGALLARRGDPATLLTPLLWGLAAGMALAALGWTYPVMLAAVMVTSFFGSAMAVTVPALLAASYPDNRRRILTLNLVAGSLVAAASPLLAEGLSGMSFGVALHAPFAVLAGLFALAAALRPPASDPPHGGGVRQTGAWPGRPALALCGLIAIHGVCDSALANWFPVVARSAGVAGRGIAPGVVLSAVAMAYLVSRLLLGLAPEGKGARLGMVVPGLLGGGVMLLGLLSRDQLWLSVCYVCGAFLWSVEYPVLLAALSRENPRGFGTAMTVAAAASSLGTLPALTLLGWFCGQAGPERLWLCLLPAAFGFMLVGLGGWLWLRTNTHKVVFHIS